MTGKVLRMTEEEGLRMTEEGLLRMTGKVLRMTVIWMFWSLVLGALNLFVIWCLGFSISLLIVTLNEVKGLKIR